MNNSVKFTSSQIRYMIWLSRLSRGGFGVKNVELATVLNLSKPSVHNMLKALAEVGIVAQESFGLARLTEQGRVICQKYERCFCFWERKMHTFCGDNTMTETAICGILAELSLEKINELCNK